MSDTRKCFRIPHILPKKIPEFSNSFPHSFIVEKVGKQDFNVVFNTLFKTTLKNLQYVISQYSEDIKKSSEITFPDFQRGKLFNISQAVRKYFKNFNI